MAQKHNEVTPEGTAIFPCLRTPEYFDGDEVGYTVKLALTEAEMEDIRNKVQQELKKAAASPEFYGKNFSNPHLPFGETNDGTPYVKFKCKASYVNKSGETKKRSVRIFNAYNQPIDEDTDVGYGSRIKVAYTMFPYWKNRNTNGISLRIEAVQVLSLIQPGERSAESYGFTAAELPPFYGEEVNGVDEYEENPTEVNY